VQARLSRWRSQGKLIQLRRGRYLLSEEHRRFEVADFYIANCLYRPSYVSLQSALEHYDMIPEAVGMAPFVLRSGDLEAFEQEFLLRLL